MNDSGKRTALISTVIRVMFKTVSGSPTPGINPTLLTKSANIIQTHPKAGVYGQMRASSLRKSFPKSRSHHGRDLFILVPKAQAGITKTIWPVPPPKRNDAIHISRNTVAPCLRCKKPIDQTIVAIPKNVTRSWQGSE